MVSCFISRIVILIFGTLYPAYSSYKAVRTKNVKEYVKWMMYWIVFALFTCVETFTDLFLSFWFPFYYEIKIITVIYLLSPATNGSSILYRKFVHPVLTKREQEIDEYIAKAKEQGYHTMLNLGSKGVTYATSLIMQTALKGGGGLFNQLKKSYSLNDLSEDQRSKNSIQEFNDQVDNRYMEDPRVVHRLQGYSPRHTISGTSYPDSYFSELDAYQEPLDLDEKNYFRYSRGIPYSGISSGYSSEDSLPFGNAFKEPALVRTASLGPTNRILTRASAKNALPKRASLAEGGSTWSMEEPRESQLDSEGAYHVPWTRSLSLPFSVTPISHLIKPEYHHLFGQITPEEMLTFLNHAQYDSVSTENVCFEIKDDVNKKIEITTCNSTEISSEKNCSVPPSQIADDNKNNADVLNAETVAEKSDTEKKVEIKNDKEEDASIESSTVPERSGKYNKRPAPVPPNEDGEFKSCSSSLFKQEKEEEEEESSAFFVTPNASPTLEKKLNFSVAPTEEVVSADNGTKNESEKPKMDSLEIPKKTKVKRKNISKKLHLPKMSFSFWSQKNTKTLSGSESSSIASSDNVILEGENNNNKNDLEFFIPLKDEKTGEEANEKEQQSSNDPSIKQSAPEKTK